MKPTTFDLKPYKLAIALLSESIPAEAELQLRKSSTNRKFLLYIDKKFTPVRFQYSE